MNLMDVGKWSRKGGKLLIKGNILSAQNQIVSSDPYRASQAGEGDRFNCWKHTSQKENWMWVVCTVSLPAVTLHLKLSEAF